MTIGTVLPIAQHTVRYYLQRSPSVLITILYVEPHICYRTTSILHTLACIRALLACQNRLALQNRSRQYKTTINIVQLLVKLNQDNGQLLVEIVQPPKFSGKGNQRLGLLLCCSFSFPLLANLSNLTLYLFSANVSIAFLKLVCAQLTALLTPLAVTHLSKF